MTEKHFYAVLVGIFLSLVALSLVWEFWLEDRLGRFLIPDFESESLAARLEFVISVAVFSCLALLGPAWIGRRLILRDQALQAEIERMLREDYLTRIYNRRQMTELLQREVDRCHRYGDPFVLIIMDLDFFKRVNDRYGHAEGDRVLKAVAALLRASIRSVDLVGRWGGEEFMIICPATALGGGVSLAQTIRARLAAFDFGRIESLTASFGVAEFIQEEDIERIVIRADKALYVAKANGRNRVESA